MQQLNPYLIFDGNCDEAMRFYEATLGGTLETSMTYAQMPGCEGKMPPGTEHRIIHARLRVGDSVVMASDGRLDMPYEGMKCFALNLNYTTVQEARRIFDALAAGGSIGMAFEATFWAEGFGMLTDRFGTPWMVNGPQKAI
ncbi:MAG: VOC family protein [Tahibacter sp.]